MFSFRAYFWNNDVYINGIKKYAANEIITAYLNSDYLVFAEEYLDKLKILKNKLVLIEDMDYNNYTDYNHNVYTVMDICSSINKWLRVLPPYSEIIPFQLTSLDDILNYHSFFFEDGIDNGQDFFDNPQLINEYGAGERDEYGNYSFRLFRFIPKEDIQSRCSDLEIMDYLNETNDAIANYIEGYIKFLDSYISIHCTFKIFIEQYLHTKGTFPNANEVAQAFINFNREHHKALEKINCRAKSIGYKALQDSNNKPILCEELVFEDLLSFVYYDFFNGIRKNYIPNCCKHCGKFFLLRSGKYYSYCQRPLKDDPDKTCRDVGARRLYNDKCKNDPIWQTYNRAYKAHYARYMKKKMTIAEFEQWSRFASDLREKALAGKIDFERYYADIRK